MVTDLSAQVSAAEAARMCGLSEKTVRRWIAAGKLKADKQAGAYSVALDEVSALAGRVPAHGADRGTDTSADVGADTLEEDVRPAEPPGTDILRAEAMAAYTRSVLEPLVASLERSQAIVREQAETIGELRERLAAQQPQEPPPASSTATPASDPAPWLPAFPWRSWWLLASVLVAALVAVVGAMALRVTR